MSKNESLKIPTLYTIFVPRIGRNVTNVYPYGFIVSENYLAHTKQATFPELQYGVKRIDAHVHNVSNTKCFTVISINRKKSIPTF